MTQEFGSDEFRVGFPSLTLPEGCLSAPEVESYTFEPDSIPDASTFEELFDIDEDSKDFIVKSTINLGLY